MKKVVVILGRALFVAASFVQGCQNMSSGLYEFNRGYNDEEVRQIHSRVPANAEFVISYFNNGNTRVHSCYIVTPEGRVDMKRYVRNWAMQGGDSKLSPESQLRLREAAEKLFAIPPTHDRIPEERTIRISFHVNGRLETRTYDQQQRTPELPAVLAPLVPETDLIHEPGKKLDSREFAPLREEK